MTALSPHQRFKGLNFMHRKRLNATILVSKSPQMLVTNSFGVVEPAIGLQIMMETILHLFLWSLSYPMTTLSFSLCLYAHRL